MTLAPGNRLGPYEILAPLGAGGMGEVYRARDTKLGREVAIKVLPAATASDPDRRQRFEQEARSASALNHPNILTIYDIGGTDGTVYIAMELVEGKTLRELVAAEPLPTKKLLDTAVQIAEGLAKAHTAGIVHRDLKPENLMVSKDGYVKILDFGLAKLTDPVAQEESVLPTAVAPGTTPGTVMGTVGYMSPEQASGQIVDFRSDQFTLGSILYEMATGKRAFQRKTGAETLAAIIREEPEPLSQLAPRAPAPLRWIVERCLAKDPEERYASTKDLARDLRSARDHLSEASVSGGLPAAEPARIRRRGFLPSSLLALGAGAAIALLAARQLRLFEPPPPQFQRLTFRRGTVYSARFAPDGNTILYGAAWEGNPVEVFSTRPESTESRALGFSPADVLSVSPAGELALSLGRTFAAGWETIGTLARVPLSGGTPRELLERVQEADWSPDGKQLAVVRDAGERRRLEYPIGKVLYESGGWISHPRVSPDGRLVGLIEHPERGDNEGRVRIVDTEGKLRLQGPPARGGLTGIAWTPRGEEVWYVFEGVRAVTPSGKDRIVATFPIRVSVEDIARDGRALLKRTNWRREIIGQVRGDTRERNLSWLDWSFPTDISEDGQTFLFEEQQEGAGPAGNYLCYLRKTDGSPAVLLGEARGFALSPDGKWALTVTGRGADQRVALLPTGPGTARPLPSLKLSVVAASFFPDGKRVLMTATDPGHGSRLYVQDVEGAGAPRPVGPTSLGPSNRKPISPDGRLVAALGLDRKILVFPLDGGAPRALPGAEPDESPIRWSADGRSIYVAKVTMPARVFLVDVQTGQRTLWKELTPPDPAGVLAVGPILIAGDGETCLYSYRRTIEDLVLATGLK